MTTSLICRVNITSMLLIRNTQKKQNPDLRSPFFAGDAGHKGGDEKNEEDGGEDHDNTDAGALVELTRDHQVGLDVTISGSGWDLIRDQMSVQVKLFYSGSVESVLEGLLWIDCEPMTEA